MSLARHNKSQYSVRLVGSPHFRGQLNTKECESSNKLFCKFEIRPARKVVLKGRNCEENANVTGKVYLPSGHAGVKENLYLY